MAGFLKQINVQEIAEEEAKKVQIEFYKGAPPQWLNFHIAEKDGQPLIKRTGYEEITKEIEKRKESYKSISSVRLLHQPGSGGTTLAMQVLWDLKEEFKCAVLVFSEGGLNSQVLAREVIKLFKEGEQKTVLLLMDNFPEMDDFKKFKKALIQEIDEKDVTSNIPVVIILECVRKTEITETLDHVFFLQATLLEKEQNDFSDEANRIKKTYEHEWDKFHGFNIMSKNFRTENMRDMTKLFLKLNRSNKKSRLISFLSLLSTYAPDSYIPISECEEYLGPSDPIHGRLPFEEQMQPFTDLLVTFTRQENQHQHRYVRVCHPLIANECIKSLNDNFTLSDVTTELLNSIGTLQSVKYGIQLMLRTRETNEDNRSKRRAKFSRLITDIGKDSTEKCVVILTTASEKFKHCPFMPQTLARFYYIEMKEYKKAAKAAQEAIDRDSNNSYVVNTLGQVHKSHLKFQKNINPIKPGLESVRTMLGIAKKALDTFNEGESLAEEYKPTLKEDDMTMLPMTFNYLGKLGYVQVASTIFNVLTDSKPGMVEILTQKNKDSSLSNLFKDDSLKTFDSLIANLKQEVEKKCEFLEKYFTYTSPYNILKNDKSLLSEVRECHKKYSLNSMTTIFTTLLEECEIQPDLMEGISKIVQPSETSILAEVIQSCNRQPQISDSDLQIRSSLQALLKKEDCQRPECYLLALLVFWPENKDENSTQEQDNISANADIPINAIAGRMKRSYEKKYGRYFSSRNLMPFFFLGNGNGLSRLVHKSKIVDCLKDDFLEDQNEEQINKKWRSGEVWENNLVKDLLPRIRGFVKKKQVYTLCCDRQVPVQAHGLIRLPDCEAISFYLGFNIKGPVAYNIKKIPKDQKGQSPKSRNEDSSF